MKNLSESDVQKQIIHLLLISKFMVIRFNSGNFVIDNRYIRSYFIKNFPASEQSKGLSDILAIKDGRAYFFEVKRKGGKESEAQKKFRNLASSYGAECFVVDSFEMARNIVLEIFKGKKCVL